MENEGENVENVNWLSKYIVHDSVIGILLTAIFGGIMTYALLSYIEIVQDPVSSRIFDEKVVVVRDVTGDNKPKAYGSVDDIVDADDAKAGQNFFSDEYMGLSFIYPDKYSIKNDSLDDAVSFKDERGDVIIILRHEVEPTISIDEYLSVRDENRIDKCKALADCVVSEISETVIVFNRPALIRTPNEHTVFIRGNDEVFEILTTGSFSELEDILHTVAIF